MSSHRHSSCQHITVVFVAMGILVFLIPSPIDPEPYTFKAGPPVLDRELASNRKLQKAEHLFDGVILGPESFAVDKNGWLYTGTGDGKIWRTKDGVLELVTRTGINHTLCGTFEYEPVCGRPKGMRFHDDGYLYVVDSYKGLLRVNSTTGEIKVMLKAAGGVPFKFLNSMDIASDGTIYFTDSSSKWDRRHFVYEVIETNNLGRLMSFHPGTGQIEVLLDGLYLANGVALSQDESHIIISEMSICQLTKYYLMGEKRGQRESFHANLPGYPDNIKRSGRGTYFVGLASSRFHGASPLGSFLDNTAPYPQLKKFIVKLLPFWIYPIFQPKHAILLEIDKQGRIVESFHDPDGRVVSRGISEAFEHREHVYIGHFAANYLGQLKVSDMYDDEDEVEGKG